MAFRSLHMEKAVYLYITAHKNGDRFECNISLLDWLQQKFD